MAPERIASETKTIRKLGERTNERPSERNGIVVHASRLSARRFMRPVLVGCDCPVSSCRPVVQRRRGACWDAGTRRLALSGEPTSKKRAVADEVVEKATFVPDFADQHRERAIFEGMLLKMYPSSTGQRCINEN